MAEGSVTFGLAGSEADLAQFDELQRYATVNDLKEERLFGDIDSIVRILEIAAPMVSIVATIISTHAQSTEVKLIIEGKLHDIKGATKEQIEQVITSAKSD